MKDEDVIKAVIEKAVKNGWNAFGCYGAFMGNPPTWTVETDGWKKPYVEVTAGSPPGGDSTVYSLNDVIFNVKFAKALWGEELMHIRNGVPYIPLTAADDYSRSNNPKFPVWHFHLQQLVLAENRIEYLKQFIE